MTGTTFDLSLPMERVSAAIFATPHSGRDYPPEFLARAALDRHEIRSSEDAFVDLLFANAPLLGAPLISARAPRAFVDLNRAAEELDPALIEGLRRGLHNPRIASGLGVIPRVVANGRPIYRGKIRIDEANRRLSRYWHPYHQALGRLMDQAHQSFGEAILIDCHSMPHEATLHLGPRGAPRPEVVLGDRFGAAASAEVVSRVEAAFAGAGLRVTRNMPFAGAYVTQAYGRPSRRRHAIQIEIDRALYMDEQRIEPRADFAEFQALIDGVIGEIVAIGRADMMPVAAE